MCCRLEWCGCARRIMAPPGEITEYGEVDSAPLARGYHVPDGRSRGKRGAIIHSHTLHGLVWDQRPMGLTHDILIAFALCTHAAYITAQEGGKEPDDTLRGYLVRACRALAPPPPQRCHRPRHIPDKPQDPPAMLQGVGSAHGERP